MIKVKKVFFLTDEETDDLIDLTGDKYILKNMPHYLLEDGTMLYSTGGASDYATEVKVRKVGEKDAKK